MTYLTSSSVRILPVTLLNRQVKTRSPSATWLVRTLLMLSYSCDTLTFSNLAGADPADVEVLFEKVQLLPEQLLVVPPRFHPLLPVARMDYSKIQREC